MKLGKAVSAAAAAAFLCLAQPKQAYAQEESTTAQGVYVGNVDLSGMTLEEGKAAVNDYVERLKEKTLTLVTDGKEDQVSMGQLGLYWANPDIAAEAAEYGRRGNVLVRYKALEKLKYQRQIYPLELAFDEAQIRSWAEKILSAYQTEPVEPALTRENGIFTVTGGTNGVKADVTATLERIGETLASWNRENVRLETAAQITPPVRDPETLRAVQDLLGSYTTDYNTANTGRSQSLELSARRLDGTVVYPGETISVSTLMGPRTIEGGYGVADAYIGTEVTDSVGAGICQTASTLYAAALYAELTVTERYNHSMTVNYMPAALDATIYAGDSYTEPLKDLKLRNDYSYPVYIEASAGDGRLTFSIYGKEERASGRSVSYVSSVLSETWPTEITWIDDGTMPLGYQEKTQGAYPGVTATLTKVVTVDGVQTEQTLLHTDQYKMVNEKWTRGTNAALGFDEAGNVVPVHPTAVLPENGVWTSGLELILPEKPVFPGI